MVLPILSHTWSAGKALHFPTGVETVESCGCLMNRKFGIDVMMFASASRIISRDVLWVSAGINLLCISTSTWFYKWLVKQLDHIGQDHRRPPHWLETVRLGHGCVAHWFLCDMQKRAAPCEAGRPTFWVVLLYLLKLLMHSCRKPPLLAFLSLSIPQLCAAGY